MLIRTLIGILIGTLKEFLLLPEKPDGLGIPVKHNFDRRSLLFFPFGISSVEQMTSEFFRNSTQKGNQHRLWIFFPLMVHFIKLLEINIAIFYFNHLDSCIPMFQEN